MSKKIEIEIPGDLYSKLRIISLLTETTLKELIFHELEMKAQMEEEELKGIGYNLSILVNKLGGLSK